MARRAVLYGPVAAGIGGDVAAYAARVAAARITGIKEAFFLCGCLQIRRAHARFDDGVEGIAVYF